MAAGLCTPAGASCVLIRWRQVCTQWSQSPCRQFIFTLPGLCAVYGKKSKGSKTNGLAGIQYSANLVFVSISKRPLLETGRLKLPDSNVFPLRITALAG